MRKRRIPFILLIILIFFLHGCGLNSNCNSTSESFTTNAKYVTVPDSCTVVPKDIVIPDFSGDSSVEINNNRPMFSDSQITTQTFENYSALDEYGRSGVAFACLGKESMPTEERGDISNIKPSGWQQNYYDTSIVETGYLMSRCHLIMRAAGGDDTVNNMITGTSYFNETGMLPYEMEMLDAVTTPELHVMYRVTPMYRGSDLLAEGVLMECLSVEDNGATVSFCVFVYNICPGVEIDYATGCNWAYGCEDSEETYIVNLNTKKFHKESCESAHNISEKNKNTVVSTKTELIRQGYAPCGSCNP